MTGDHSMFNYCICNCSSSHFYQCHVSGQSNKFRTDGFVRSDNCSLYGCTVDISQIDNEAHGFYENDNGNFYHCIVNINARCRSCYGFSYSENCNFYCCKAEIKNDISMQYSVSSAHGYGFFQIYRSLFIHTDAKVHVSIKAENENGRDYNIKATAYSEGFCNNYSSTYLQCSYSLSATAEAVPNSKGYFTENEYECGVSIYPECKEGYRCERRTENGTESC